MNFWKEFEDLVVVLLVLDLACVLVSLVYPQLHPFFENQVIFGWGAVILGLFLVVADLGEGKKEKKCKC